MASNLKNNRNREIYLVWEYLRRERKHTADFCRDFMRQNYFIETDYIYKILQLPDAREGDFDVSESSLVYRLVMSNNYQVSLQQPVDRQQMSLFSQSINGKQNEPI